MSLGNLKDVDVTSPGQALASAIEALVADRQQSATNTRNSSFAGAGQKLLEPHGIDASSDKFRFLMTRFRGDGDEDLPNNTDILLSEYPELESLEGIEGLTLALSKAARPANRAVLMERVQSSMVRSVIRPLFFEYPLERLARETGFLTNFDKDNTQKKTNELRDRQVSRANFEAWTRDVYELFQETSVLQQDSTRSLPGIRMPGIINSQNIRRYTNVWFDFTANFLEQILERAKNVKPGSQSIPPVRPSSRARLGPRYSSVGSLFNYNSTKTPAAKISVALSAQDDSYTLTKDWDSKESFDIEIQKWILDVIETMSLPSNKVCLLITVRARSTQTSLEIKNRDVLTAIAAAKKFLGLSL
jgi:hypothetical protein